MPGREASPPKSALLTLRLDLAAEPIRGTVTDPDGRQRPFRGWLELTAALDQARGFDEASPQIAPAGPAQPSGSKEKH